MSVPNTITLDNVEYIRKDSVTSQPAGNRAVVVVDRGWIFAGDVVKVEGEDAISLVNAIHVFNWESIGFDGMLENPTSSKVKLVKMKKCPKIPNASIIFTVPVQNNWGS